MPLWWAFPIGAYAVKWEAIVVGGGHAGCEAARLMALRGLSVCLLTDSREALGRMSCNPSIGGVGKGHLVREIDALGGLMAKAADLTGIHFRLLNASKGSAVQGLRCQSDRARYAAAVRGVVEGTAGLEVREGRAVDLLLRGGRAAGVALEGGEALEAKAVVVTAGTFLGAVQHRGERVTPGGRVGEFTAQALSAALRRLSLPLMRLKTGTPPRLHRDSVRWEELPEQHGDVEPEPFSLQSRPFPALPQVPCHLARTTLRTAQVVRENLSRSPLYAGAIRGVGPRYCPSFEDKVVKFPHHLEHHLFLEPDGLESEEVYPAGLSTSLPEEVQEELVRSIPGLEGARILRAGYAVEYDAVDPRALDLSLESRAVPGLYFAGQVVGTTGYEEAAGLGLYAGWNAARALRSEPPFRLGRDEAYLGVMVDDLVTRGVVEPYRLLTSRAEFRLLLDRHTAYARLTPKAEAEGVLAPGEASQVGAREAEVASALEALRARRDREGCGTLYQRLLRPEVSLASLLPELPDLPGLTSAPVRRAVEAAVKGACYREREQVEAARTAKAWGVRIPAGFDYRALAGLSREAVERLEASRPETLGQAARTPGLTAAALTRLRVALEAARRELGPPP